MRLQDATSNFEFSKSQTLVLSELEKIIRPDQGSVATKINEFFSALNTVAQDASDLAARNVAVDAANSVAYAIKNAAAGIISLRENVNEQIKENVSEINDILGQLAIIQKSFWQRKCTFTPWLVRPARCSHQQVKQVDRY